MAVQVVPLSLLRCQVKVGVGVPLAATVKVAALPAFTIWLAGWVVIKGAALTIAGAPPPPPPQAMTSSKAAWARNSPAKRQERADDPLRRESGGACLAELIRLLLVC